MAAAKLKNQQPLILASSSKYRQALLSRLKVPFSCYSPEIDETAKKDEAPRDLVQRLAAEKAQVIASKHRDALVIGSDQIALFNRQIIGKPGNHKKAIEQLKLFSNNEIQFLTAVTLVNQDSGFIASHVSTTLVKFRKLTEQEIENYLIKDTPYDCAGSFKIESLGCCLFEKVTSDDPTSLQGLPLIILCQMLKSAGFKLI